MQVLGLFRLWAAQGGDVLHPNCADCGQAKAE
jgi:hypothetical protein